MIDSAIRPPLSGSGNEIARDETFLEIGMIGREIESICSVYIHVASLSDTLRGRNYRELE